MIDRTCEVGRIDEPDSTTLTQGVAARAEPGTSQSNEPELTHSNSYSEIRWRWPDDFDGFEEFVTESRKESGYGREPPLWW
jgi:hypothetical protein